MSNNVVENPDNREWLGESELLLWIAPSSKANNGINMYFFLELNNCLSLSGKQFIVSFEAVKRFSLTNRGIMKAMKGCHHSTKTMDSINAIPLTEIIGFPHVGLQSTLVIYASYMPNMAPAMKRVYKFKFEFKPEFPGLKMIYDNTRM